MPMRRLAELEEDEKGGKTFAEIAFGLPGPKRDMGLSHSPKWSIFFDHLKLVQINLVSKD